MTLQERMAMSRQQDNGLNTIMGIIPALQEGGRQVQQLPVALLQQKENHTFTVRRDTEYYRALKESIRESGVRVPLLVRRHPDKAGMYEIVAGHTRYSVALELEMEALPCIVAELTDDEADIAMGETNIQRPDWLPSERARTFALWLEATRRRTGIRERQRTDVTAGTEFPQSGRNRDVAAEKWGITGKTFDMYLKLNELYPPLLKIADDTAADSSYSYGRLPVKSAYQLAFLPEEAQRVVYNVLAHCTGRVLREPAAIALRQHAGQLLPDDVREALGLLSAPAREKKLRFSLPADLLPEGADKLCKDLEFQTALADWITDYLKHCGN